MPSMAATHAHTHAPLAHSALALGTTSALGPTPGSWLLPCAAQPWPPSYIAPSSLARVVPSSQLASATAIDAGRVVGNKDDRARETGPSDTPPHQEDSVSHIHMPSRNYFRSGGF